MRKREKEEKKIDIQKDNKMEEKLRERVESFLNRLKAEEGEGLEDWEYLIHHIHVDGDTGEEIIHHCFMVDHLGNLYEINHIKGDDGKIHHCLTGLKDDQDIYWSNEEAIADGETIPCANRQLED